MDATHNYLVYMHTNIFNNKKYIGITYHKNPNKRWQNGNGYRQQKYFYTAIKKDGWDNFKHEILFENLSEQAAKKLEIELIAKYNLTDKRFGYNISIGGDGYHKYKTEEDAHKAYLARQKVLHNNRKLDPEKSLKDKLSNARSRETLYADKERKRNYIEICMKNQKNRYSTIEGKSKILESAAKSKQKLKNIRNELFAIYKAKPELFTVELYDIAFGKNAKGRYNCNSIKKLTGILNTVTQQEQSIIPQNILEGGQR